MGFLEQLRAERARLPSWAPAGAVVVDLPETRFGALRVAIIPVDPGERAARKVQALQALAPGLRAMARLKERGDVSSPEASLALMDGVAAGLTASFNAKATTTYKTSAWLLCEGVIGLAYPAGDGEDDTWRWLRCTPVMDVQKAVLPGPDDSEDTALQPWVPWFFGLGGDAAGVLTTRIDALTGVE